MSSGFFLIDKPAGMTSHDALMVIKRKMPRGTRIGHTGTLDPFATGLLVVGIGEGLKFFPYLKNDPKIYEAVLRLGTATDTLDKDGAVTAEQNVPEISAEHVESVFRSLLGPQEQIPPMFSAKKVKGQKLYELARQGQEVERKPVPIILHSLEMLSLERPFIRFRVSCSTGTYVRVLGMTIAEKLETVGHLTELRRIQAGDFSVENAWSAVEFESGQGPLMSVESALTHWPSIPLDGKQARRILLGQPVQMSLKDEFSSLFVVKAGEQFLGMAERREDLLWPKRLMATSDNGNNP